MNPINLDKVKKIVDILVNSKVIDKISDILDHGFGEVTFKISIQNGVIKAISLTDTKTVKIDQS